MGLFDRLKACFFDKDNGDAEQLKQAATTPNPNAFSMPERPDRFVEGPNDFRADSDMGNSGMVSRKGAES